MALQRPVAVYTASTNAEAQLIRNLLIDSGIEAFAVEDVSQVGAWSLGLLPEIHRPQVWVDRSQLEEAKSFLAAYEQRTNEPRIEDADSSFCYQCGEAAQPGAASCVACGEPLDWSEEPRSESGAVAASDAAPLDSGGALERLRAFKKPFAWFFLAPFLVWAALAAVAILVGLLAMIFR